LLCDARKMDRLAEGLCRRAEKTALRQPNRGMGILPMSDHGLEARATRDTEITEVEQTE